MSTDHNSCAETTIGFAGGLAQVHPLSHKAIFRLHLFLIREQDMLVYFVFAVFKELM